MTNISIRPKDKTLSDTTIPDQVERKFEGNEGCSAFPKFLALLNPHNQIV